MTVRADLVLSVVLGALAMPAAGLAAPDDSPSVGVDASGGALVAWVRPDGSAALWPRAGGAWGAPVELGPGARPASARVAVAASGRAVVVWVDATSTLRARLRPSASAMFGESIALGRADGIPDLAIADSGEAVLGWIDGSQAMVATHSSLAGWSPALALGHGAAIVGADPPSLSVAVTADGSAAVAWGTAPSAESPRVRVSVRAAPGAAWQPSMDLGAGIMPSVAIAAGRATVAWERRPDSGPFAFAAMTASVPTSGGAASAPLQLGDISTWDDHVSAPALAIRADGTAVVAWIYGVGRGPGRICSRHEIAGAWAAGTCGRSPQDYYDGIRMLRTAGVDADGTVQFAAAHYTLAAGCPIPPGPDTRGLCPDGYNIALDWLRADGVFGVAAPYLSAARPDTQTRVGRAAADAVTGMDAKISSSGGGVVTWALGGDLQASVRSAGSWSPPELLHEGLPPLPDARAAAGRRRVAANRRYTVKVSCPEERSRCHVRLTARTPKLKVGGVRRFVGLGSAAVDVFPGQTRTVYVAINTFAAELLKRRHTLPGTVTVRTRYDGGASATTTASLRLLQ